MKYLRTLLIVLTLATFTWFCLYTVGVVRTRGDNYVLGNNISQVIDKKLKPQDSQEKVLEFLDNYGLYDREILRGNAEVNEDSLAKELGAELHGVDGAVIVLIPEVESSLTSRYHVTVFFYFDKHQKMIDYKIKKMGVGL